MRDRPAGGGTLITMEDSDSPARSAILFSVFVLIGSAYIILAKLDGGVRPFFVTFIPVLIMFGYAGLIWFAKTLRLRDDQSGDNLYYMGFLFTLTSLGVSLYQFSVDKAAEEIVQNFGIAIGSTIAGIGLRVFFNQMRRDPVEVERTTRLELADAARRVRRELDSSAVDFNHFRRSVQQMLEEGIVEHAQRLNEASKRIAQAVEEITKKSATPLEDASKKSGSTIEALTTTIVTALESSARKLSAETDRLSKNAAAISSTLEGVSSSLAAMQTPDKVIELKIDPAVQTLTSAALELKQQFNNHATEIATILDRASAATEASSQAIKTLQSESQTSEIRLRETVNEATALGKQMVVAIANFKAESTKQVDQMMRGFEQALHSFGLAARPIDGGNRFIPAQQIHQPTKPTLQPIPDEPAEVSPPRKSWWGK